MTNMKSTKRALICSALALILCFSMLVGTTFAWFTDSVTSANNVIQSGNLDIDLDYWDGDSWETVDGSATILDPNALWEPGYTEVAYFRIRNNGSLALKYQFGVNIIKEKKGVNVYGDELALSDSIYFDVIEKTSFEPYATREAAMADTTETTLISTGFSKAGKLPADSTAYNYLTMIIYMPETVGNDANPRSNSEADTPKIELGINVIATQQTAESDAFGPDYDANASLPMSGNTSISENVAGNVAVGENDEANVNLNGKEIEGGVENKGDMTVSNGTIGGDVNNSGDMNVSDVTVNNTVSNAAGGSLEVNGGTINSTGNNALYNEGNAELKDVTINMTGNTGYITNSRTDGSITVYENVTATSSGGGVNVWEGEALFKSGTITTNSTSTSARHMFYVANGAKLTIEDGEFFFNPTNLTRKGSYICADANAVVEVYGGVFHKPSTRTAPIQELNGATVTIFGGTFYFDPSAWLATGYEAVKVGDAWIVGENIVAASNSDELAEVLNDTHDGITVVMAEGNYTGISFTNPASYKAKNVTIVGFGDVVLDGFSINGWSTDNNIVIDGLTFKNITFSSGLLLSTKSMSRVTVENCKFINDAAIHQNDKTEKLTDLVVKNCTFAGDPATTSNATAIMLENTENVTVTGCTFEDIAFNVMQAGVISGTVLFDNNTVNGTGDRVFRFVTVNADITISNNVIVSDGDGDGELAKSSTACEITFVNNTWNGASDVEIASKLINITIK